MGRRFLAHVLMVVVCCGMVSPAAQAQDLRYPQLENAPAQNTVRSVRPVRRAPPPQAQPAPPQRPSRTVVHLPFIGRLIPDRTAPAPRWPTASRAALVPVAPAGEQPALRKPATPVQAASPAQAPRPQVPETVVGVIGDAYANDLTQGLTQLFAGQENTAFVRATGTPTTGFVGGSDADWQAPVKQMLERKSLHALVFFIGVFPEKTNANLRDDDRPAALANLYAQRMDMVLAMVSARGIPVIWVGLPPVENEAMSRNHAFINNYIWQKASSAKGLFVDVWEPFVNEQGEFSADGVDVDGQTARLRTQDGRYFTRAGRRKMASSVATNIRLALTRSGRAVAGLGQAGQDEKALRLPKQAAGVFVLSQPPVSSDGSLVTYAAAEPAAVEADGVSIPAPEGRADDYLWKRP